jgi:hypothetical protein
MYSCVLQVNTAGVNPNICSQQAWVTFLDAESWLRVREVKGQSRLIVLGGRGNMFEKEIETTGYFKERCHGVENSAGKVTDSIMSTK